MFAKFDQALGKSTPTTSNGPIQSRADEIRGLAKQSPETTTSPEGQTPAAQSVVSKTAEDYSKAVPNFLQEAERNDMSTNANPVVRTGENALAATASGINTVFSPISNAVKSVSDSFANSPGGQAIANNPVMGKILDFFGGASGKLDEWSKAHPEAARNLSNALTVGTTALGGESKIAEKPIGSVEGIKTGAANLASDIKGSVSDIPGSVKGKATQMALDSEKKGWTKPAETPKGSYTKATEIFKAASDNGHNISDTLANNKLKLSDHVETSATGNKVFNTADTAEKMHADAAKTSNEMLRPALEKADASVPKTPVKDVINESIKNVQKSKMTSEVKDRIIESLDQTRASLEKAHPDGLSLTDLHDEKIVRDANAKYSPVGDVATNMEATKNKAIADVARKMVEEKAPPEIPVKAFNAELAKQHQAANYLDALHGKPVPKSVLGSIAKTAAKVVGASVGSGLGGGVLGGVGGYHIGGMVESLIESVPNPVKSMLLDNLKTTNPEAFTKVQGYLNNLDTNGSVAKPMTTETSITKNKGITKPTINSDIKSSKPWPKKYNKGSITLANPFAKDVSVTGLSKSAISKIPKDIRADALDTYRNIQNLPNPNGNMMIESAKNDFLKSVQDGTVTRENIRDANEIHFMFKGRK